MKNKNNDSEIVTRGILRETLTVALDDVVTKIVAKIDEKINSKIDSAVGNLAIMVEKGFAAVTKDISSLTTRMDKFEKSVDARFKGVDKSFAAVFVELKEIRKEIGVNELK